MRDLIERMRNEHRTLEGLLTPLLSRVARRPVCRQALADTLSFLDERVAHHERDEEARLFPGLERQGGKVDMARLGHAVFEDGRRQLRDGLIHWNPGSEPAGDQVETLACLAEETLHGLLDHFAEEEQLFNAFSGGSKTQEARAGA
jgi:hemerythrin-like domain-containing protein